MHAYQITDLRRDFSSERNHRVEAATGFSGQPVTDKPTRPARSPIRVSIVLTLLVAVLSATGCTSILTPMSGTPVAHLPAELLGVRRSNDVPVPIMLLSIPPGQPYRLDEGDILGVYIESVLPFTSPASIPSPPPINFPSDASTLPPSIGFPIAIQADGLISLPLLEPFSVKGLTIEQARKKMKDLYLAKDILASKDTMPIVSLIRERTYNVIVVRENATAPGGAADRVARGQALKLPAYQNDLLHAYVQSRESELFYTGGLLRGGQFPVPRDYDLDVLGAMALAGMGVDGAAGGGGGGIGGGMIGGLGGSKPTQLFVIRKLPSGRTFNIAVDLQLALNDSNENILVQPGDTLILRFKPHEELLNFALGTFFTFGIRELFRGN